MRHTFRIGWLLCVVNVCGCHQHSTSQGQSANEAGVPGASIGTGGTKPSGAGGAPSDGSSLVDGRDASTASDASSHAAGPWSDGGTSIPGWKLVWSDEFDGSAGQKPDAAHWVAEVGGNGWGNDELEFYTDRAENAALDGKGALVITARSEAYLGRNYSSARLKTQGKFEHAYGRFEARIQLPAGQGIWPAFWLLGNDLDSVRWPACGEIDIMEQIGKEPSVVHGTLHGPGYSGDHGLGASFTKTDNAPFAGSYHVFSVEWETSAIRFYVDDTLFETRTPADLPQGTKWVYDHPFFIILNLAVGGQWPGNPDATTVFPQRMQIDYVRVYDKAP